MGWLELALAIPERVLRLDQEHSSSISVSGIGLLEIQANVFLTESLILAQNERWRRG